MKSSLAHTSQTVYSRATTPYTTAQVKVTVQLIKTVVDAKLPGVCTRDVQAIKGFPLDGEDANDVPHKATEAFLCLKSERT